MDFKKTKIVCTIGPSSWDYETMKKMAVAGMDVVRMNFSHGAHSEKAEQIGIARRISEELNRPIAIFADLQGPKMRLGIIEGIRPITKGDIIRLSLSPINESELPMQFDLSPFVKKNQRIYLNDGLVELKVLEVNGKTIKTRAENDGVVSSNKGVNVPDTNLGRAAFTDKDVEDAIFALGQRVDYLALSFVQTVDDLKKPIELIKKYSPATKIIVKIEKSEAIDNLEAIVKRTDAVMVARGDLAIETDNTQVPILQQKIIKMCRQFHKPVIVATQMLESMIENPRPTRAEVSDVANAVMDQADAVMLSAESANGKYPVEAVTTMKNVIQAVERHPDYNHNIQIDWDTLLKEDLSHMAIASSAATLSTRIQAEGLVVGTVSGYTTKLVASFRPNSKIIAITHDEMTSNQLSLVWGVTPIIIKPMTNFSAFIEHVYAHLLDIKLFNKGDKIVFVTGMTAGVSGTTNTIKVAVL